MTRPEILFRYRDLRQISKQQHEAVLDITAGDVLLDWARRIDLTQGRTVIADSEYEIALAEDLEDKFVRGDIGRAEEVVRILGSLDRAW